MATPRKLPSGSWRCEFMLDGQRHSITRPLRKQVIAEYRQALVDHRNGQFIPPDRRRERVSDRLDAWLELKASDPNFRDTSLRQYTSLVRNHIRPQLGGLTLEALTVERVETWRNDRVAEVGTATAKAAHLTLRSFLTTQVNHGYMADNPAKKVSPPKHTPKDMTILEPHELAAVAAECEGATCSYMDADGSTHRLDAGMDGWVLRSGWAADVVRGLLYVGARVGDFSRLVESDWDRVNGRLFVTDSKTGNDRWLPVFPELQSVLERSVGRGGERLFMMDGIKGQSVLRASDFASWFFKPALESAGIGRPVRIHDLRHSTASWLIKLGFGPVQVAAYLGHSNPATTMKVYSHLFASDMASMGEALDQMAKMRPDTSNVTELRKAVE